MAIETQEQRAAKLAAAAEEARLAKEEARVAAEARVAELARLAKEARALEKPLVKTAEELTADARDFRLARVCATCDETPEREAGV